jgi:DnaJ homolog subfamily B member 13
VCILFSLSEFLNLNLIKKVMNDDGHTSSFREKILTITVKRGWKPGTRITFEQEGDQGPNSIPADIVFIVKDKPHAIFRRDPLEPNLIYTQKIPLSLALIGTTINVPTLDGRVLDLPITDIVKPGYTRIIPGEGMPFVNDPRKKGDLIIEFDIEFPGHLNAENKDFIKKALIPNAYKKEEYKPKKDVNPGNSDFED